jgi:hypothetical protein
MRGPWIAVVTLVVAFYSMLAISPLKTMIGRKHPAFASMLSPPLFNFSSSYESGSVLDFAVGMNKKMVFGKLKDNYVGRSSLLANCTGTRANSLIPITESLDISSAFGGGNRLCIFIKSGRLFLEFFFQDDAVSKINVSYVRTEGT